MSTATVTSKGQITIPKDVRDDLNLTAGSKVMFVRLHNGHYRIVPRTGRIQDLAGILHDPDAPAMTIAEINEAIAEGAAESGMRGLS
ncbi:MAG: AbrB/MazE/SpoVT family DNA-binding domain-containing protein [Microbacterium sp.]